MLVVMNHAADDRPRPFACQKAAQLTTKIAANHACCHSQHKLLVVGTQQQTKKGRGGGGEGEGAGPGARGGTEDDDKGLGLSEDFFFKCGRRLSSVPTCTSSSSSSCYIAQFHITKIPRPVSNSPPTSKFNLRPTFLLLKSAHLSIYLQPLLLSVVVVVVVLELLQLLLLLFL
jgi:hypothetical protein